MNITTAQYVQDDSGNNSGVKATVNDEIVFIPLDESNRHYMAILEWVANGNTIADAE